MNLSKWFAILWWQYDPFVVDHLSIERISWNDFLVFIWLTCNFIQQFTFPLYSIHWLVLDFVCVFSKRSTFPLPSFLCCGQSFRQTTNCKHCWIHPFNNRKRNVKLRHFGHLPQLCSHLFFHGPIRLHADSSSCEAISGLQIDFWMLKLSNCLQFFLGYHWMLFKNQVKLIKYVSVLSLNFRS